MDAETRAALEWAISECKRRKNYQEFQGYAARLQALLDSEKGGSGERQIGLVPDAPGQPIAHSGGTQHGAATPPDAKPDPLERAVEVAIRACDESSYLYGVEFPEYLQAAATLRAWLPFIKAAEALILEAAEDYRAAKDIRKGMGGE